MIQFIYITGGLFCKMVRRERNQKRLHGFVTDDALAGLEKMGPVFRG